LLSIGLFFGFACSVSLNAQDTLEYRQPPVIVTTMRSPVSSLFVSRSFEVIDRSNPEMLSATSIGDVLQRFANVNIQSRGVFGAQTDLSIRGTLFSQNLILLNGSRLDDPQTAHHNFDLPLSLEQVERIEVLRGPSSSQYGANASGGVVNIITRIPENTSVSIFVNGGNYGLFTAGSSLNAVSSGIRSSNTISYSRSSGYRYDTDFSIMNLSTSNEFPLSSTMISLFAGYTKKEFGAFDFYSPGSNKPSKEWTETAVFNISSTFLHSSFQLTPKLSFRKHFDRFMDDIRLPNQNIYSHTTTVMHSELVGTIALMEHATMVSGAEWAHDDIASNVYKQHSRNSGAVFTSVLSRFSQWTFDAGVRTDFHSDYSSRVCPTIGIGYLITPQQKIYGTAGRSFRAPTYTELYIYNSTTHGDPSLRPETDWSYETGWEYYVNSHLQLSLSIFEHAQNNLIDYVRYTALDTAQAINFSNAVMRGVETSVQWNEIQTSEDDAPSKLPRLEYVSVSYGFLDSRIEHRPVFSSRYSYTHPRHQISLFASGSLPFVIQGSIGIIHKIKLTGVAYTLVDARFSKRIFSAKIYISGSNLLNQTYEEITGVPLPGRWLWAGIEVKIL
jgi:outer membrane cobalamin receptor